MPAHVTILYRNEPGTKFDLDYYLLTHIPLVRDKLGPHGLTRWEVTQYEQAPGGPQPAYRLQCLLAFETAEQMGKALSSEEAKATSDDMANFTDANAVIMTGSVVGAA
jgi:uncharacterized protein (TIGR02118 family)